MLQDYLLEVTDPLEVQLLTLQVVREGLDKMVKYAQNWTINLATNALQQLTATYKTYRQA